MMKELALRKRQLPLASKDPTIAPNTNEALSFFKKGGLEMIITGKGHLS